MLEWRARAAADDPAVKDVNFLGIRYDGGPDATVASPLVNREHLLTLIKADRHFPETYLILGDVLFADGDLQDAARAYVQGMNLQVQTGTLTAIVEATGERMAEIANRWEELARRNPGHVFDFGYQHQIEGEFAQAAKWLDKFKEIEATLIQEGATKIDFATVLEAGTVRHLSDHEPKYLEAGLYAGKEKRESGMGMLIFSVAFLLLAVSVLAGIAVVIVRAIRRRAVAPMTST